MMFSTSHNALVAPLVMDTTLGLVYAFLALQIVIIAKYILQTTQQILQMAQMARILVITQAIVIIVVIIMHLA